MEGVEFRVLPMAKVAPSGLSAMKIVRKLNYHPGQNYVEKNPEFWGYFLDFGSNIKVFG